MARERPGLSRNGFLVVFSPQIDITEQDWPDDFNEIERAMNQPSGDTDNGWGLDDLFFAPLAERQRDLCNQIKFMGRAASTKTKKSSKSAEWEISTIKTRLEIMDHSTGCLTPHQSFHDWWCHGCGH